MPNLINSAADLKANFSALSLNFKWENISSYAQDAETDIIGKAISPEALLWFQTNLTGLAGVQLQALNWLQRSVSYLTVLKWSQTALFQFEDKALFMAKTTAGVIPSDNKLVKLRTHCSEEGFKFLDKALDLMENNLGSFDTYATSATRLELNKGFIKTAIDFSKQRNISNSRLTFLSMYYFMIDIQEEKLPDILTPAYYDLFKTAYFSDTLDAEAAKLLPFIKKALAMLTIGAACKQLPVQFNSGGLFVNRYEDHLDYGIKDPADQSRLQFLADDHDEKGERYLQQLQDYINTNFALLAGYVAPPVVPDCDVNSKDSGLFFSL